MHFHIVSLFPEIYDSFLQTSLLKKAIDKGVLSFSFVNPRQFCLDKQQQVDDEIYGGGAGMLMKAKPIIESVESIIKNLEFWISNSTWKVIYMSPSEKIFNQEIAYEYADGLKNIIFVCGRYEGIDFRFEQYMQEKYPAQFVKLSMGRFVTLGGELPSMVAIESIARLIPWVIKEEESHIQESYSPEQSMRNLEYPQYTRPEEIFWYKVPEVLLSGHHAEIEKWRKEQTKNIL